jgi:DNA-3-methyladenine glycosylase I
MPKAVKRCPWAEDVSDLYLTYHDKEWGVPAYDDATQFEFLLLEGAQAGLSWSTVLNKREGYRKAFANFDVIKVSRFSEKKIEKLLLNPGIIRNRLKVNSAVNNAKLFLQVQKEFGSFSEYIWVLLVASPSRTAGRSKAMCRQRRPNLTP